MWSVSQLGTSTNPDEKICSATLQSAQASLVQWKTGQDVFTRSVKTHATSTNADRWGGA